MTTISTTVPRPAAGDAGPVPQLVAAPPLGQVFWAIFRKEARELAIVLGLMALGYGAVLALALWQVVRLRGYGASDTWSGALNDAFLQCGVIVAPVAGLLVGLGQYLVESRPDRFGVLVHRPVSRGVIFGCKAVAGLGLYAVAMLVPLLATMLWASSPRHIPLPFSWWMAQGPLADIFSGVPYYFAGILVARRTEASWAGSRLLPVLAPVIASVMDTAAESFGMALAGSAVATLVLATAALGYFAAAGQYPRVGKPARAATAVTLLTALLLMGLLCVGLLESVFVVQRGSIPVYRQALILRDGTAVVEESVNGGDRRILDLSGKELGTAPVFSANEAFQPMALYSADVSIYRRPIHAPATYFRSMTLQLNLDGAAWFCSNRSGEDDYLVGFDLAGFRRVGAIGANGLEPDVAVPTARFGAPVMGCFLNTNSVVVGNNTFTLRGTPGTGRTLLAAGETVYRLLNTGQLERFYVVSGHHPIRQFFSGVMNDLSVPEKLVAAPFVGVVTDDDVTILSAKGEVLAHEVMPGLAQYRVSAGRTETKGSAGGAFVMRFEYVGTNVLYAEPRPAKVVYFKPDGSPERTLELPLFDNYEPMRLDAVEAYVGLPLAPPLGTACAILGAQNNRHFAVDAGVYRQAMLSSGGMGVLAAVAVLFLGRRRGMSRGALGLWAGVALLAAPAAVLLMFCLQGLVYRVRCPACGKSGPVTAGACPHCGAARPAPGRNGTEIFA